MSTGRQFIHACCIRRDRRTFRKPSRIHFTEEEHGLYDFTVRYLAQYSELPPLDAFAQAAFDLTPYTTEQPPEALLDRLYTRYGYGAVQTRHDMLQQAMRRRDMGEVEVVLREMLSGVAGARTVNSSVTLAEHAPSVLAQMTQARMQQGLLGASLCWPTLDAATHGVAGGELVFVVGRPGTGKTWLLLNIAEANVVLGKSVLFISMEMGLDQITRRWLGLMTGVNPNEIRTGMATMHEEQRLNRAAESLGRRAPIHLVSGDLSKDIEGVEAIIEDKAPDVVCIDALYLLRSQGAAHVKKWEVLTDIVRATKRISLTKNVPIISTVQFNRNQSVAGNRALALENIGGSDAIPQDASIVIGTRPFPPPHTDSRIYAEVLKNREGDAPSVAISRSFDPVRFVEVPMEDETQNEQSMEWMT
jgi:replicative DNA helicase